VSASTADATTAASAARAAAGAVRVIRDHLGCRRRSRVWSRTLRGAANAGRPNHPSSIHS
ncbi:hypothetical protein, partial [Micromonospora aurantiaca (nom. illeg.)]|uniref:hypothetical protein n=1 Tax=Micromonospora aurantiaca (nom. illeg.) TaxID=47850 RepID=UPI003825FDD6